MIKIIERGTRAINVCPTCGCKYSYEKEDIKIDEVELRYGGNCQFIECPQCHERNYIQQAQTLLDIG